MSAGDIRTSHWEDNANEADNQPVTLKRNVQDPSLDNGLGIPEIQLGKSGRAPSRYTIVNHSGVYLINYENIEAQSRGSRYVVVCGTDGHWSPGRWTSAGDYSASSIATAGDHTTGRRRYGY